MKENNASVLFWANGIYPPWNHGMLSIIIGYGRAIQKYTEVRVKILTDVGQPFNYGKELSGYGYGQGIGAVRNHVNPKRFLQLSEVEEFALLHFFYDPRPILPLFNSSVLPSRFKSYYGKPFVVTCFSWENRRDHLLNVFLKANCRFIDKFVVVNQKIKESLQAWGISDEKIEVVPPLVDCEELKASSDIKRSIPVIGYVGHATRGRGVELLVKACARLKKRGTRFKLLLAWSEYQRETQEGRFNRILEMAKRNNLESNLVVQGYIEEKIRLYDLMDILVLPFIDDAAVSPPLTLLEGLACEKIVLCTDACLMEQVIRDEYNGFLMRQGDEKDLANKLEFLIDNLSELKNVRKHARETVSAHFSSDVVGKELLQVYKGLVP